MQTEKIARRWLATFLLGTIGPLVLAQSAAGGGGQRGRDGAHIRPRWQECAEQPDGKNLPQGEERDSFIEQCMNSAGKTPPPGGNQIEPAAPAPTRGAISSRVSKVDPS